MCKNRWGCHVYFYTRESSFLCLPAVLGWAAPGRAAGGGQRQPRSAGAESALAAPANNGREMPAGRAQVKGRHMCFLPVPIPTGARRAILLTGRLPALHHVLDDGGGGPQKSRPSAQREHQTLEVVISH